MKTIEQIQKECTHENPDGSSAWIDTDHTLSYIRSICLRCLKVHEMVAK